MWAIASVSISAWRSRRGEPQPGQWATCSGASRRQSRQKPGMVLPLVASSLAAAAGIGSRRLALPTAPGDRITPAHPAVGGNGVVRRKRNQQRLVGGKIVEHAEEKLRLAGGGANGIGAYSAHGEKAAQPLGLAGDESERGDGERFGRGVSVRTVCPSASLRHDDPRRWTGGSREARSEGGNQAGWARVRGGST